MTNLEEIKTVAADLAVINLQIRAAKPLYCHSG